MGEEVDGGRLPRTISKYMPDGVKFRTTCCETRVRRLGCETSLNGVNDGGDASDIFL